jgi:hypothetical protein
MFEEHYTTGPSDEESARRERLDVATRIMAGLQAHPEAMDCETPEQFEKAVRYAYRLADELIRQSHEVKP